MAVALCATSLVVLALLWEVSLPFWDRKLEERRARKAAREAAGAGYDPGRERRAEQRARELLAEYCVAFPDETRPYGSARLPDSDDVLAKWMALTGDERHLIGEANMHLPGRQVDPKQARRDLWRLTQWEQARLRRLAREHRTTTG